MGRLGNKWKWSANSFLLMAIQRFPSRMADRRQNYWWSIKYILAYRWNSRLDELRSKHCSNNHWCDYWCPTRFVFLLSAYFSKTKKDCCQNRYRSMCVTLSDSSGSELAEKCTAGENGEPYLENGPDGKNIVIPFDSVNGVKSIKVSFNGGRHGQIQTFIVGGCSIAEGQCSGEISTPGLNSTH